VSFAVLRALVLATWREKFGRPVFGVLCLVVAATDVMTARLTSELQDPVLILTLLIASGSVGKDVSSGVLPLLFTRPLKRSRYVLAKWLASASAIATLAAVTTLVEAAVLAHIGAGLPRAELAAAIFKSATTAFGLSAVLVLFSVLASGFTDVLIWIGLSSLPMLGQRFLSQRVVEEWQSFLHPSLDWGDLLADAGAGFRLVSYLSTVTLCLGLAVLAVNRKELSYASG
jgi:hypothetical protein